MVLLAGFNPDLEGTSSKLKISLESIPGQSLSSLLRRATNTSLNSSKRTPAENWTKIISHST
jgi:hypothetical protein